MPTTTNHHLLHSALIVLGSTSDVDALLPDPLPGYNLWLALSDQELADLERHLPPRNLNIITGDEESGATSWFLELANIAQVLPAAELTWLSALIEERGYLADEVYEVIIQQGPDRDAAVRQALTFFAQSA